MYECSKRRNWANKRREKIAQYKLEHGCIDCGYKENAYALEFDHLPGSIKERTVASLMYNSWREIWEEINKCEIVCANCHKIRTYNRKKNLL